MRGPQIRQAPPRRGREDPEKMETDEAEAAQPVVRPHKIKWERNTLPRAEQRNMSLKPRKLNLCHQRDFIFSILEKTALNMNISLYCDSNEAIPEMKSPYFGSHIFSGIHDIRTAENHFFHIKVATRNPKERMVGKIGNYFHNDVYFHQCVDRRLKMFFREEIDNMYKPDRADMLEVTGIYITQGGYADKFHYESIGTMTYARLDEEPEVIVMSNLYKEGFKPATNNLFTQNQMFTALRELAKFHGLSMAFKKTRPLEFQKFLDGRKPTPLYPNFSPVLFREVIDSLKEMFNILQVWGLDDVSQLKNFVDHDAEADFRRVIDYKGKYTCLVHMDCSINKFLFNASQDRMKFTDFYHWCPGTAIYDISYMLFTRGHYQQFTNVIRPYLETYYEMFIVFCARFGHNAHEMYPYEYLIREWDIYNRFGLFMAIHHFVKRIPNTRRGMAKDHTKYMAKMRLRTIYRWLLDTNYLVTKPESGWIQV